MLKMNEIAATVRRMVCVGSVVLVGVAGTERVMASEVTDAEAVVQKAMPAASDAAPIEWHTSVKVVPAEGADALVVKQMLDADIKKLGDVPHSLNEVNRWSDVLTTALRQGGLPCSDSPFHSGTLCGGCVVVRRCHPNGAITFSRSAKPSRSLPRAIRCNAS